MIDILYEDSSHTLRFEVPAEWATPSGVNLTITRSDGTAVLASTAATLGFTATTLSSATVRGATSIVTAADMALEPGDVLRIAAGASGPAEDVEVSYYDTSNKTAYLVQELDFAHASGAAVSPMWATIAVDISDTDDFPLHRHFVLEWENASADDLPATDMAYTVKRIFRVPGYRKEFARLHPDLYATVERRWDFFERSAYRRMSIKYRGQGRDLDRFIDAESMIEHALLVMRTRVMEAGGDEWRAGLEQAKKEELAAFQDTLNKEFWTDDDEDLAEGDEEKATPTTTYTARNM